MANIITAGNSTNGGTAITTDTSGTLNIVTGSGSGTTAVTVDGSGNMVVTGTLSASGGVSGGIRSGTAVASTSGTSIDFTSLPTGLKRITVMFSGVSTNGTSDFAIQLGTGSTTYTTTGYSGSTANTSSGFQNPTTQVLCAYTASATSVSSGIITIALLNSSTNLWSISGTGCSSASFASFTGYSVTLSAALTAVRIKTGNGTDTFDAGSINILYE